MSARKGGKILDHTKHSNLFSPYTRWRKAGTLVKAESMVAGAHVLSLLENRNLLLSLYDFRGRYFVYGKNDNSVFYELEME